MQGGKTVPIHVYIANAHIHVHVYIYTCTCVQCVIMWYCICTSVQFHTLLIGPHQCSVMYCTCMCRYMYRHVHVYVYNVLHVG